MEGLQRVSFSKMKFLRSYHSREDDTWEPISNLECPDNIQEYETNKKKAKKEAREAAGDNIKVKREVQL